MFRKALPQPRNAGTDTSARTPLFTATGLALTVLFAGQARALTAEPSNDPGTAIAHTPSQRHRYRGDALEREVTGTAPESAHDIPQSIDTISQKQMTEQGNKRLTDALRDVPGITLNAGEGGSHGDSLNLRGLSVPDSFFLDGIRDIGLYQRDTFDEDQVAVLLGPSSILFGRGSTAGVINEVSKEPLQAPLAAGTISVGSAGLARSTADFNWVLNDTTAARLNLMGEHSGVAERDLVENRRSGIAPSIAFGIGTGDRLTLSLLHQEENDQPDYGIPFVDGAPAKVDRSNYYGLANYDHTGTDVNIFTGRYEHDFGDNATLTNTTRAAHYKFAYIATTPNLADDFTEVPPPGTPLADIGVYATSQQLRRPRPNSSIAPT